jgi:O-antigen/teichoic acid export membrane protein
MELMTLSGAPALLSERVRGVGRGTAATLVTRLIDAGATYGFYAILAHTLSPADVGRFVLGITILLIGAAVARRGLDQALLALPIAGGANRLAVATVAATALVLALVGAIALAAGGVMPPYAPWLLAGVPAVALSQIVIGALRAGGDVTLAATAECVSQPVGAFAFAAIAALWSPTLPSFAIAFVLSWTMPLFFAPWVAWDGPRLARDAASRLLATGTSMLGVYLFQQAANSADILILGVIVAPAEVAHYAVAQKIGAAFLLLHGAVTTASAPFIRRVAGDRQLLTEFRQMVTRWSVAGALPLLVVAAGVPTLLLRAFGAQYVHQSAVPLALLSFAGMAFLLSGPVGSILLVTGREALLFRITAAGATILLLSVAALAPFGAVGAATGMLAGTLLTRGLMVWMLRRYASQPALDGSLIVMMGGAIAGIAVAHVAVPALGEIGAALAGNVIPIAVALLVLQHAGDLAFLRAELLPRLAAGAGHAADDARA